jgi:fructuronate reductase
MDSSLKIPIRFGETIKAYKNTGKNCADLKLIPMVFAAWLRYLLGVDDQGKPFEVSPDPNYETLTGNHAGIKLGLNVPFHGKVEPILSNSAYFGVNLYEVGLGLKVEEFFTQMLAGVGAVRKTLDSNVNIG